MPSLPITELKYKDPPSYSTVESYRRYLREISNYSCAYCNITEAESSGATFNIDHFRPKVLFSNLVTECSNLRYSCPRCNSYKKDKWISVEEGCSRDCESCTNHMCQKNISRFIDVLNENPSKIMRLADDYKIYACSGSKVAQYTIDYLRLNRMQLIRLRHMREFMDKWEQSLIEKLAEVQQNEEDIKKQRLEFIQCVDMNAENKYSNIVDTIFQLLEAQTEQMKLFIGKELENIRYVKENSRGKDDRSLPPSDVT